MNDRLEAVHKGLGEMQTLASGVGGPEKGAQQHQNPRHLETQLGMLLDEALAPAQYDINIARQARAAPSGWSMPSACPEKREDGVIVHLPIDAKFPLEGL